MSAFIRSRTTSRPSAAVIATIRTLLSRASLLTIRAENIAAGDAAGVLTLTIPVHEAAKPRSIQVTSDTKQAVTA